MTATAHETPMLRWSSVRDCGRKAIYEATGAPHRERSEREERILYRGQSLGREYANFLRSKYGDDAVQTELQIEWPLGVGHMDIYLVPTRSAIEVLSSAHAAPEYIHSKLLQLVGYMEHATFPIDAGALVVLNPSDFTDEIFPVARTSKAYADLVVEMRARIDQVKAWAETGGVPPRVCDKPADSRSHFCQYAEHCFAGWTPPTVEQIAASPEVLEAVETIRNIKQERHVIKERDAQLEERQKAAQTLLADLPAVSRVGRFEVKKSHTQRSETFDWKKAELAGRFEPGLYGDFFKPGAAYDVFKVAAIDAEDFGDEAPF